ncbi:GntR family transcriptional regulator [Melghiribacillus thermohalophilus]|uniref:GntR family transcriptional regulator n=1 Tax=Melghiribacillus thermohalophilus TaxID=1324956 RepID=A0A4V2V0R2_9BACI|nr:phosphonate metabolism transcriptional regulator PhnF [Melghiribacillus thermohalophilus]TCT17567.1 GntR family transcriptional regulator [Melghiribacillus thermohalophilus]
MINKESPIPIYYQLQEHLKTKIENGELKSGDPIPSEREMAEKYEISRMTVRQAVNNLVNEGLLTRSKGRGTFVADKKIEQPLMKLTGFSEDMKRRGIEPGSKLISFDVIKASKKVSKHLNINEGDSVYQISRLRLGDGDPMAYEVSYLPEKRITKIPEDNIRGSLYSFIEECLGLKIERAIQTLEPSFATALESDMLTIEKGSPVLLLERTTFLHDDVPIEYVKSIYRGDRYKFIAEMRR